MPWKCRRGINQVCVCVSVSLPTSFVNRLPDLSETHEPSALALSLSVSVFRIFTRIAIGQQDMSYFFRPPHQRQISQMHFQVLIKNNSKIDQLEEDLVLFTSTENSLNSILDMGVTQCKSLCQQCTNCIRSSSSLLFLMILSSLNKRANVLPAPLSFQS